MHPLKSESCDWLYKFLGLCFIEEKLNKELEKNPELKKELKNAKRITLKYLRETCESAKQIEELHGDEMFQMFERVFSKNKGTSDIEKAKELLESKGYRVEKKL